MNVLFVLGTRPEIVKLAPVILALRQDCSFKIKICHTGQHRELAQQALDVFDIEPDIDLNLMQFNQASEDLLGRILVTMGPVVNEFAPDILVVQGDTTSAVAGTLCGFYKGIPIAHVEAGLRSGSLSAPFPEEGNRRFISVVARNHFAPTERARNCLIAEGIDPLQITVTGNTVVDAMQLVAKRLDDLPNMITSPFVLVTCHRRENFGTALENICLAMLDLSKTFRNIEFVLPTHPNPQVQAVAQRIFQGHKGIILLPPLPYVKFLKLLKDCLFVITDSGGVQEEAPSFGKVAIVARDVTEREEAVKAGLAWLLGPNREKIVAKASELLSLGNLLSSFPNKPNPFGDGKAAKRIRGVLLRQSVAEFSG